MRMRRPITQPQPLEQRLIGAAAKLRKEAQGTPPGVEREQLIRRAKLAETASDMTKWITSPGLQPPK